MATNPDDYLEATEFAYGNTEADAEMQYPLVRERARAMVSLMLSMQEQSPNAFKMIMHWAHCHFRFCQNDEPHDHG